MFEIGAVVAKINADVSGFKSGLSEAKKEASLFGDHIGKTADFMQKAFLVAGTAAAGALVLVGKKAIDYATENEQQIIALITLLGDQAKAEEHIAVIRKDALKTPFNVSGLIQANQLLISAGVEASKAEKDILNLGDAISANGKGAVELDRIVVNMQQIKNVGKATAMDMKQFAFNGINMYQLLADSTKLPIDKLQEMDISYEMISAALAKAAGEGGKYHDANLRQSASLAGLKSNLEDTTQQMLITIANESGLYDGAKLFIGKLTEFVSIAGPQIVVMLTTIGQTLKMVTDFLISHKTEVEILVGVLTVFFLPALVAVTAQMGINFLASIANSTLAVIKFGIEGWKVIAMLIMKSVQLGIATVAFIAHTAVTIAQTTAQIALTAATWLFNAAMIVLTSPILLVIAAIVALIAIGVLLYKNWDEVKRIGGLVMQYLAARWTDLKNNIAYLGGQILDAIMWPFNEAKKRIESVVNWIKDKLDFTQRHSPSVVDIVKNGVSKVNDALNDLSWTGSFNANMAGSVAMNGGGASTNIIQISLDGAMIADSYGANQMAELLGDSIIKRLQNNIRT